MNTSQATQGNGSFPLNYMSIRTFPANYFPYGPDPVSGGGGGSPIFGGGIGHKQATDKLHVLKNTLKK